MEKIHLTWGETRERSQKICTDILTQKIATDLILYGIPRGGIYPALMVAGMLEKFCPLTEDPKIATVFIDDIVDTGKTMYRYKEEFPSIPFYSLVNTHAKNGDRKGWYVFPWERMGNEQEGPTENIVRLLEFIGEDPEREGLKETPQRVIRSYKTLFAGYEQDPQDVLKVFEDGACDEMVLLKNIEFTSCCEHHMLPFTGMAHIAYIPDGKIIGVSKLARILEIYSRRLQIQERIGEQITKCLMEHLQPKGAACVLEAKHLCMTCRGVQKQDSIMVTSSLKGVFIEKPETREEFMMMVQR